MTPTNSKLLAKTVDLVNEQVLDYLYCKTEDEPTPDLILYKINESHKDVTLDIFDSAINIMSELGYARLEMDEAPNQGRIRAIYATNTGILLNLNGGMTRQVSSEKRKENLYQWGQIAVVIAGLYYLIELLKSIWPLIEQLLNRLPFSC